MTNESKKPYTIVNEMCSNINNETHSVAEQNTLTTTTDDKPFNHDLVTDEHSNTKGDVTGIKPFTDQLSHNDRNTCRALPNEILSLILHHLIQQDVDDKNRTLHQCTLINKQFHAIANPLLWQILNFDYMANMSLRFIHSISNASPQRLSILGHHIRELHLHGHIWTNDLLTLLSPYLPNLNHLSIVNTDITDTGFQHIPSHCLQLNSLKLDMVTLTQHCFTAIGQHCHQLSDLRWDIQDHQSPAWLAYLLDCPVERLRITDHNGLLLNENAIMAIQQFDRLTYMDIRGTPPPVIKSLLSTTTTTSWKQLTTLTLTKCDCLDDTTFIRFIQSHPHLQRLYLEDIEQLTDISLDAISDMLPNLTRLTLIDNDHISSPGLRRLVQQCQHVEYVKVDRCSYVAAHDFPEVSIDNNAIYIITYDWFGVVLDSLVIDKIKQGGTG